VSSTALLIFLLTSQFFERDDQTDRRHFNIFSTQKVSREWYKRLISADINRSIWLSLLRRFYPTGEPLARIVQLSSGTDDIDWKLEFRKKFCNYTKSNSPYFILSPDLAPPCLSEYVFQIDIRCDLYQTPIPQTISTLALGGLDVRWDDDNLSINWGQRTNDILSSLNLSQFSVDIHVIQKSGGKQALIFSGEPEDWVDDNLFFYGNFSPPRRVFPNFGLCAFLTVDRCLCSCSMNGPHSFFQTPNFQSNIPPKSKCCNCCTCEKKWSCFNDYGIIIVIRLMLSSCCFIAELGQITEIEFLRYLEKGLFYL